MPTLLAIETATELASVALLRDGHPIVTKESFGAQTHSQTVLPMVQSLLAETKCPLTNCDAIAFGCGPGSFTGVRTACGVVQGLAFATSLPVLPVVTLTAMAQMCRNAHPDQNIRHVLAILDARMGEVYWAQYVFDDTRSQWQSIIPPGLSAPQHVTPQYQTNKDIWICHFGVDILLVPALTKHEKMPNRLFLTPPHARAVAQCGQLDLAHHRQLPAEAAQPLYLRNKVALTIAERENK